MPSASDGLFDRARELFDRVCELPAAEQEPFVRKAAGADRALHEEVMALLRVGRKLLPELQPPEAAAVRSTASRALLAKLAASARLDRHRFVVANRLGIGGMGVVHSLADTHLRRMIALKQPTSRLLNERQLGRFLSEAQIQSQLTHPGIAPVYDLGLDDDGHPFFTMRQVTGMTASEAFRRARADHDGWTLGRALEVVLKVCDTIAYAHSRGVLHRDLKPANVMVGEFGEVYVMDWGIAKIVDETDPHDLRIDLERTAVIADGSSLVTHDGKQLGTPFYMSPEQARSQPLDERTDVYGIGAMLYELLTGREPYREVGREQHASAVLQRVVAGPPVPIERLVRGVAAPLVAIVEKAMARDRAQRFQTASSLAADLRAFVEHRTVSAYRSGPWVELQMWVRRNRELAASALTAVVALVAGIVISVAWAQDAQARESVLNLTQHLLGRVDIPVRYESLADLRRWVDQAPAAHDQRIDTLLTEDYVRLDNQLPAWGMLHRLAKVLELHTLYRGRGTAAWERVVRELDADPRFVGFPIEPDPNFVPIGRDPDSGLEMFWHPVSGEEPQIGADGRPILREATGIVMMLLPPGNYTRGSRPYRGANDLPATARGTSLTPDDYGQEDDDDNEPVAVAVGPCFASRYELTQAQWRRLTDTNPSRYHADDPVGRANTVVGIATFTPLHPVECISWVEACHVLRMIGLELPSESQWEYAYRGGTTTRWFSGPEPDSLFAGHYANLRDFANWRFEPTHMAAHQYLQRDDGFPFHAPVDAFAPNPLGLVSIAGNVWEFCADVYRHDANSQLVGDQAVTDGPDPRRIAIRGGGWASPPREASAGDRWSQFDQQRHAFLGARPFLRARVRRA